MTNERVRLRAFGARIHLRPLAVKQKSEHHLLRGECTRTHQVVLEERLASPVAAQVADEHPCEYTPATVGSAKPPGRRLCSIAQTRLLLRPLRAPSAPLYAG